ncbi:MAG: DHA2 family efflux MFS transporter permease subunit [Novosphingobium sp.]
MITISIMAAALMNQVDTTIANVALPHIQGTTSASREQVSWVLTSYIIAMAITTPLTGWLAERFGRRTVLLMSIVGFTISSGLCGISTQLEELVMFRVLQGVCGAALMPITQVLMVSINPPEERGRTMAIFGFGFVLGPLIGPLLGGWLTDNFSWHWVFLINLPVGALAFIGVSTFLPDIRDDDPRPFDLFGFSLLALGIGMFQLMLDRGDTLDWFHSTEVSIEAGISALMMVLFAVHISTASNPFVRLAMFTDRNFNLSLALGLVLGLLIYGTLSLLPPMLAGLFGQPIMAIGIVLMPRGLGTALSSMLVGRLVGKVDVRLVAIIGLVGIGLSSAALAGLSLDSDTKVIVWSGFISGFAMSMLFVPLSIVQFSTLPRQYMDEAAAFAMLFRYLGAAAGISIVQMVTTQNLAAARSRLTEGLRPDNPWLGWAHPDVDPTTADGAARLVSEVSRQAMMVAYIDVYWFIALLSFVSIPLALFIRMPKSQPAAAPPDGAAQAAMH